mgnify:CR=1 FL=1
MEGVGGCSTEATGSGDLVARGTYPAVANLLWTGEWDAAHHSLTGPVPALVMDVLRTPSDHHEADGRASDRGLGLGCHQAACLAADHRRRPRADRVRPVRAGRLRPPARRPLSRSTRTRASTSSRASSPAERGTRRRGHGARARRLLRRRGRPRLQRIDVRGAGRHTRPARHRVGGDRRDRHHEGSAPRRRTVGGRRPAEQDRLARARARRGSACAARPR